MRKIAGISVVVLIGLVATTGCQQQVLSETYRPLGPSMKANNTLAQGQARNGPVLTPQAAPEPAAAPKSSSPDVWDWLTGVFEGPDKPAAPQTAPMMSPQPAASAGPSNSSGQRGVATP